ncbi:MAG TPA: phosphatidylserine decarboxylase family protein [Ignavibacteriaceae bacterium]
MMFTKYGYTTIGVVAFISFLFIVSSLFIQYTPAKISLLVIAAIILFLTLNFFRDPERTPPLKDKIIVSPADGKVLFVKKIEDKKFINSEAYQISVFMSPLDVHVNRIPISGKVDLLNYYEGEYIAAFEDKSSELNERMEIGITSINGKIFFTQVAGFVARRIVNDLKRGEEVKIGNRFGMIKFGSRSDIIVSSEWTPMVKQDDRVTAGETILFELNK